jgi:hypothetical protein
MREAPVGEGRWFKSMMGHSIPKACRFSSRGKTAPSLIEITIPPNKENETNFQHILGLF